MSDDDYSSTFLDVLQDILATDRSFFQVVRFLDGQTRNNVLAMHLRNTGMAYRILDTFQREPRRTTMVMNIPISMDLSGSFFDPVPVVPTREQVVAATQTHVGVPTGTMCAICQEEVACATRIRSCGHLFHGACIDQWFQMNPRCPVCRHDIRLLQNQPSSGNE
jgi:hypothetical protein